MALVFPVVHDPDGSEIKVWEFLTATQIRGKDPLISNKDAPPEFFTRDQADRNYISPPIIHNGKLHLAYSVPYDSGNQDFFGRVAYQNANGTWGTLGSVSDVIDPVTQASFCTALASFNGDLYAVFSKASKGYSPPFGNEWPAGNSTSFIYKYNETTNIWEHQYSLQTDTGSILGRERFFVFNNKLHLFFLRRSYSLGTTRNQAACAVLTGNTWSQSLGRKADNSIWSQSFSPNSDMRNRIFDGRTQILNNKVYFILRTDASFVTSSPTLFEFNVETSRVVEYGWGLNGKPPELDRYAYRTVTQKNGEIKVLSNFWRALSSTTFDYSNAKDFFWLADKGSGSWSDWTVTSYAKPLSGTFYFVRDFVQYEGKDYILLSMREGVSAGQGGGTYIYQNDGSGWSLFGSGPIVSGSDVFDFYGYSSNIFDQKMLFINGDLHVIGIVQNSPLNDNATQSSFFIARAS